MPQSSSSQPLLTQFQSVFYMWGYLLQHHCSAWYQKYVFVSLSFIAKYQRLVVLNNRNLESHSSEG